MESLFKQQRMKKIKIKGGAKAVSYEYEETYKKNIKSPLKRTFSFKKLEWLYYFYVYIYDKICGNCKYYDNKGLCTSWKLQVTDKYSCSLFRNKK